MGMFDSVTVEPSVLGGKTKERYFQTKSFEDPEIEEYTITKGRRLLKDGEPHDYTGALNFYTYDEGCNWIEFDAQVESGVVGEIVKSANSDVD